MPISLRNWSFLCANADLNSKETSSSRRPTFLKHGLLPTWEKRNQLSTLAVYGIDS